MDDSSAFADLRITAFHAKDYLKAKGFRHVVYAYIRKSAPDMIVVLDWDCSMVGFKTDQEFDTYLKAVAEDAIMIYAVHALA